MQIREKGFAEGVCITPWSSLMLDLLGRFQKASLGGDASGRCRHSVLILENFTHSQKILMSKLGLKLFLEAAPQASSCSLVQVPPSLQALSVPSHTCTLHLDPVFCDRTQSFSFPTCVLVILFPQALPKDHDLLEAIPDHGQPAKPSFFWNRR